MFFSMQIQMLMLTQPPPVGPRPPAHTQEPEQSDACPLTLLQAVLLQNLSDTSSDPSSFLHQPECARMPATGTCSENYQTVPQRAFVS